MSFLLLMNDCLRYFQLVVDLLLIFGYKFEQLNFIFALNLMMLFFLLFSSILETMILFNLFMKKKIYRLLVLLLLFFSLFFEHKLHDLLNLKILFNLFGLEKLFFVNFDNCGEHFFLFVLFYHTILN